jgi:hypothetical protein
MSLRWSGSLEKIRAWLSSWSLSSLKRAALLFVVVLVGVESMVVAYYWDAGAERLEFELAMTAVIATTVGLPVILYVVAQYEKLKRLTEKLA